MTSLPSERDPAPAVTYADFARLARQRGWTAASLAERFRGKIEEPRAFFERVFGLSANGGELSGSVIPYQSVLEFYQREAAAAIAGGKAGSCECGCGKPVYGRKRLASDACRKRQERRRSQTPESGSEKVNKDKGFSVTFSGDR